MDLETLLKTKKPEDWESLSQDELEKLLKPYLIVTRPSKEKIVEAKKTTSGAGYKSVSKSLIAEVARLNAQFKKQQG